jgi:release factor glutamine methyltransferase
MIQFDLVVPDQSLPAMARALEELLNNKPLQYVLGKARFLEAEFIVNQHVLIPRPETEELTKIVIDELDSQIDSFNYPMKLIDIGTGSGCIAITLKNHFPEFSVVGLDKSDETLEVARMNAANLKAEVSFWHADLFDPEAVDGIYLFDVIVSNPPYVLESEKKQMHPNVYQYEPAGALFVPDSDPLIYYKAIAEFSAINLRPNGYLFLEINEKFGDQVKSLFLNAGFINVEIRQDLSGKDRFLICRSNRN